MGVLATVYINLTSAINPRASSAVGNANAVISNRHTIPSNNAPRQRAITIEPPVKMSLDYLSGSSALPTTVDSENLADDHFEDAL